LVNGRAKDELRLDGQVVVVTGAAQGLGRAHAEAVARRGAQVFLVDVLDCQEAVAAIREAGGEARSAHVDLASPEAGEEVLKAALAAYGQQVDALVNNAGLVRDRMSFNLSAEQWSLVLAVNLSATFFLSQAVVRHWRGAGRPGAIVNTTSESGLYGNAGQANYAAAKAGVAALTITMATELDRNRIRVNAIAPRARTPMSDEAFGELPRDQRFDRFAPEHVAAVVAWLLSDAAAEVSGQVFVVHGAGIEVMQTWSAERQISRGGDWSDSELLALRGRLLPDGGARRLAAPVGALFAGQDEQKEE
jgi:3-oxoacyl-[acyl-carrier protein] reductase